VCYRHRVIQHHIDTEVDPIFVLSFEVFMAVTMKNNDFWDVAHVAFVTADVSEELIASIIRKNSSQCASVASYC
jgi:hypothetical protein